MVLSIEQKNELRKDAIVFRREKLIEILEKGDKASSLEISLIQYWGEYFRGDAW